MISLPAPLLRGLSVAAIGAALAIGHITLAASAPKGVQVASAGPALGLQDAATTGSVGPQRELAENCYFEIVQEKTSRGRIVTRRVHECD